MEVVGQCMSEKYPDLAAEKKNREEKQREKEEKAEQWAATAMERVKPGIRS